MNPAADIRPILVHGLPDARTALAAAAECGCAVLLASAPAAGCHAGGGWFRAVIEAARREHPTVEVVAVLDCGDQPGAALAALRAGVADIALDAPDDVLARVRAIAGSQGARLHPPPAGGLDLRRFKDARQALLACRRWLSGYTEKAPAGVAMAPVTGYQGRVSATTEREKGT